MNAQAVRLKEDYFIGMISSNLFDNPFISKGLQIKFLLPRFIAPFLTILLCCACVGQAQPAQGSSEGEIIIDMHCHAAGLGYGGSGCFVSDKLRKSFKIGFYLRGYGVTKKLLEEHGDGLIIQKTSEQLRASRYVTSAIVLAMDGVIGPDGSLDRKNTEIYVPNEFVLQETAKYDNLYFGASVNPYRPDAIERLKQAVLEGALLIKWIPSIMQIDPADERIIPFYREMSAHNIPLLTHAGNERSFTMAANELSDPKRLELPLRLGVTVIAAHAAATGKNDGEDNMERLIGLMESYPNLYTDISSLTQINKLGYLSRLLRHKNILDHLLYGADYPLIETCICSPWVHVADLTIKQIFYIQGIRNPWDRDIELKKALGVPWNVFTRSKRLFRPEKRPRIAFSWCHK
ncbi:Amidohydrolase 2 [uncultured Desulfobacterium sp.]|uniref:Amidohydrolase 2 n=1 Tax=uncultured Desulfobacterium sp. TaxID=201089 RepID=A0A445N1T9_9BACT|nr:Amidohydrolase 2 [uncultured Desulfobacterium sp.]